MHLRPFLVSLRPWSFPVTVSAVVVGAAVAYRSSPKSFDLTSFLLSLTGGLCVHAFGNLVNTYFDFLFRVDRADNAADDRALVDRMVSPTQVAGVAIACLLGALAAMWTLLSKVSTLAASSPDPSAVLHTFLALVFCGLSLAYSYTGWPFCLKYRRLGDIVILVCFGPLLCEGSYFVHTGRMSWEALWASLPLGVLTEAILHANNARDITIDLQAGAKTLANSIGFAASYHLFQGLYFAAFASLPVMAWRYHSLWFLLPGLMAPQLPALFAAFRSHDPKKDSAAAATAGGSAKAKDICDRCGQFSFGFGMLLAAAIVLA